MRRSLLIQLERHLCNRFSGALPTKEFLSAAPNHQTSLLMRVLQAPFHVICVSRPHLLNKKMYLSLRECFYYCLSGADRERRWVAVFSFFVSRPPNTHTFVYKRSISRLITTIIMTLMTVIMLLIFY